MQLLVSHAACTPATFRCRLLKWSFIDSAGHPVTNSIDTVQATAQNQVGAKSTDLIVHSEGTQGIQAVCAASCAYHIVTAISKACTQKLDGIGLLLEFYNASIWPMQKLAWPNGD